MKSVGLMIYFCAAFAFVAPQAPQGPPQPASA
jgi:hypothetical protein